VHRNTLIFI